MSLDSPAYKGNVLFVDDAKVNLMLGSKMLSDLGLDVMTAENGQKAMDLCKNNTYQLIFMDLEMPEVGGLAAATLLRENRLSFAPIVALTGHDGDDIRLLCRAAHMNGYLKKPLKKDKLIKILDKILLHKFS